MTTTNNDPEALRREIDRTRERLTEDVDVLTESVRPSSVAKRTVDRAQTRAGRLKESIMGSTHDVKASVMGSAQDVTAAGSEHVSGAADTVKQAPQAAVNRTRGNPLAAGAVALAAGWLVGSLLPASQKERELAQSAKEQAQPLVEGARSLAQETAENLKEPVQEAVQSVKGTAQEGVANVQEEGTSRVQDVRQSASGSGT
jgi:type VI protein secretion system component VasK